MNICIAFFEIVSCTYLLFVELSYWSLYPFKYERTCIFIVFQIAFLSFNRMVMFSFDINIGFSFLERMLFVIWIIFISAFFLGTISSDPACS